MLKVKKLREYSELLVQHLDGGQILKKLNPLEVKEELDYMTQEITLPIKPTKMNSLKLKKSISIAESPAINKKETLIGKLNTLKTNTQNTKLSMTSPAESTSIDTDLRKSWLIHSKDLSKKLWLPTKTGCAGSLGNTSRGCLNTTELISSLKTNKNIIRKQNSATISYRSYMSSPHDTMELDGNILRNLEKQKKLKSLQMNENKLHSRLIKKDNNRIKAEIKEVDNYLIKSKSIRVTPVDDNSRKIINDGLAVYRKIWNCCIKYVNSGGKCDLNTLRDRFVIKKNMSNKQQKLMNWTFRISKRTREQAVMKFISNYKTAEKNLYIKLIVKRIK